MGKLGKFSKQGSPLTWIHRSQTGSTNTDLVQGIRQGEVDKPTLLSTNHQSAGRGRQGRHFYSELDAGLYLSIAAPVTSFESKDWQLYPLLTAVAMVQALESMDVSDLQVKWVNDLFRQGRKVAGILCELAFPPASDQAWMVCGIGVNLAGAFTDPDLQGIAGTLFGSSLPDDWDSDHLLEVFAEFWWDYHQNLFTRDFLPIYQSRLLGLGQTVYYEQEGSQHSGTLVGLNSYGNLIIRTPTGATATLASGEVHFGSHQFTQ